MKNLLIVSVALLVLTLACGPYDTSQLENPAKAKLLARVIIMEYEKNPIRFDKERIGNQFRVYGEIYRIEADRIKFSSKGFWNAGNRLECRFADPAELTGLSRKDKVTVVGTVESVERPHSRYPALHMVDCRLTNE